VRQTREYRSLTDENAGGEKNSREAKTTTQLVVTLPGLLRESIRRTSTLGRVPGSNDLARISEVYPKVKVGVRLRTCRVEILKVS
jgi:hypothetical protein